MLFWIELVLELLTHLSWIVLFLLIELSLLVFLPLLFPLFLISRSLISYCTCFPLVFQNTYPSALEDIDTKLKLEYFNLVIIDEWADYSCKLGTDLTFLMDCRSRIDLLHANSLPFSPPKNNNECERSNSIDVILVRGRIFYKFNSNMPSRFFKL